MAYLIENTTYNRPFGRLIKTQKNNYYYDVNTNNIISMYPTNNVDCNYISNLDCDYDKLFKKDPIDIILDKIDDHIYKQETKRLKKAEVEKAEAEVEKIKSETKLNNAFSVASPMRLLKLSYLTLLHKTETQFINSRSFVLIVVCE